MLACLCACLLALFVCFFVCVVLFVSLIVGVFVSLLFDYMCSDKCRCSDDFSKIADFMTPVPHFLIIGAPINVTVATIFIKNR